MATNVSCEGVKTSDASRYFAEKLRHFHGRTRRYDPLGLCFRSSEPGVDGVETGECKADALPGTTSAAVPVTEEDDVRTLWVDTESHALETAQRRSLREPHHRRSTWDLDAPLIALD